MTVMTQNNTLLLETSKEQKKKNSWHILNNLIYI